MNKELLTLKARKQIIAIIIVGFIVIICDMIIAGHNSTLELFQDEKGLYVVRPPTGADSGQISIRARVDNRNFNKSFDLNIDSTGDDSETNEGSEADSSSDGENRMSEDELAAFEIRSVVNSVNEDTSKSRIYLPEKLSTGDNIKWSVEHRNNTFLILFSVVMLAVLVYRNRFAPIKKQMAAEQDSIARQLPEFTNRLVLLLNAGLVLNSAFEKAISLNADSMDSNDFFFSQMKNIQTRVHQTNVSMNREFSDFARSRLCAGGETSRQLMRISNIISDNISKGVGLAEKLQRESEVLWLARKRNCEERGRLAETKLTLPLTLFLLVLIVITVSPALLEL